MITASIHGRLGQDPLTSRTKNDKEMCRATVAVNVSGHNAETEESVWVSVLGFGKVADDMARCRKGESLSAMGRLTRSHYTARDGSERESWSLMADAVVTTRSARPPGRKAKPSAADVPFDDDLAF